MSTQLPAAGSPDVLYVVDLSSYVLRAYHAIAPLSSPTGEPTQAVFGTLTMLERLFRERRPAMTAVALDSGRDTFRRELYPEYKANRPPAPDDLKAQMARCEELVRAWGVPSFRQAGVEADDLIACLVDRARESALRVVVVAADKDLMQLVGDDVLLWDTMRQRVFGPHEVQERFGVRVEQLRDFLALVGDTSDNVPGVPSVGPKTAAELLSRFETLDGVFANLEQITRKKLRETLQTHETAARLSQELVTLRRDCTVEFDEHALRNPCPDSQKLETLYVELGFQKQLTGLRRAMSEAAPAGSVQASYSWPATKTIQDARAWRTLKDEIRRAERVGFAPVFSSPSYSTTELAGAGIALGTDATYFLPTLPTLTDAPTSPRELAELLSEVTGRVVVHGMKQLAMAMAGVGPGASPELFDLLLASYLINPEAPHDLPELVSRRLGVELPSAAAAAGIGLVAPIGVPLASLADGAGIRATACHRLFEGLSTELSASGLEGLASSIEAPLAIELGRMQRRGVLVDTEQLRALSVRCERDISSLEAKAQEIAGRPFNVHSPRQLESILFDEIGLRPLKRTKTARSTDAATLEALADEHPLPRVVLELRQIAKLKSTYIDALPTLRDPGTGRIHTTWEQAVAATGRLSSTDPNMQNIPIRSALGQAIRATFIAPPGYQLVSADYSQIELRVLAHLSQDPVLVEAFDSGQDVHTRTAAEIFDIAPERVNPEQRRRAKAVNFGVVYGQGDAGLAKVLGIPKAEAARFIAAYFRRHAGVRRFMEATIEQARAGEAVSSILGRRRLLPDAQSGNRARRLASERIAMNMPIQASAADILKLAMLRLAKPVTAGARMVLTVHDELVFEVPDSEVEAAKERIVAAMTSAYELRVPLVVTVGSGANWNDAH